MKLISWNVNGMRARMKAGLPDIIQGFGADIYCFQETKVLPSELKHTFQGYHMYMNSAQKRGYSGTAILSKINPVRISSNILNLTDKEGRIMIAEYESFFLVNVYTPNSKEGLVRLPYRLIWDEAFRETCKLISRNKPLIITGDFNVAHKPIDLSFPARNTFTPGYAIEERESFTKLLEAGFIDSFRYVKGSVPNQYTCWSNFGKCRERNIGWRLDYFLVSKDLKDCVTDASIHPKIGTSDHCPLELLLDL